MTKQKRSSRRMGYVLALAAGAVVEPISTLGAPLHWVYEAVDPEKTARGHGAALDAQDDAHVVYGQDALYYDWEDADGWHSEMADATSAPYSISVALDPAGRLHVVYVDQLTYHVKYARRDQGGWFVETIAEDASRNNGFAVMCLDHAGWPHVGYQSGDDQGPPPVISPSIFHAWREPTGWQGAEISGLGAHELQFDAAGRLHVASENSIYSAVYALIIGDTAFIEELPSKVAPADPDLAVDDLNQPHIAYCNWAGRRNLSCLYVPSFALTGLAPLPGGQVRLDWQGALEGAGIDGTPSLHGPWSFVAADLGRSQGDVAADPSLHFLQLRQTPPPQPSNRSQQRNMPKVAQM